MRLRYLLGLFLLLIIVSLPACGGLAGPLPASPAESGTPEEPASPAEPEPATGLPPETAAPAEVLPTPTPEPEFSGEGPWDVTLETADGVTLAARMFGDGETGIVLAPTYPAGQAGWYAFAGQAAELGYRVIALDFRGYGESGGDRRLADAPTDLQAALDFLREQGVKRIVLMGAAQGGSAAARIAAGEPDVVGLVVISGAFEYEDLEVEVSELEALTIPSLWIGARTDMAQTVEDMYEVVPVEDKELWIYEGISLHGTYIFEGVDGPDLTRRLLAFTARVAP